MQKNPREKRVRFSTAVIVLMAALTVTAIVFQAVSVSAEAKYKIKIGSFVTPASVWGRTVQSTMDNVKKRTSGDVQIIHLHSGMLGSSRNMLEQVLMGGIQGAGIPSYDLAGLVPETHIIEMPFLFRDRDEAYYLLDNVIAPAIGKKFEKKGLVTSAFMEVGFMDFVMSRAIRTPADLKKVKIGSWESPVHVAFWKAQGANPLPIPATEVFRAYSTGMVDSGANTPNALVAWDDLFGPSFDRSRIHITPISFSYQSGVLVINKKQWDALPADYRGAFGEEMKSLTGRIRNALRASEPASIERLKKRGYQYHEMTPAQKRMFEKNSEKVYKQFEKKIGKAFLQRVLRERAKYRKAHPAGK